MKIAVQMGRVPRRAAEQDCLAKRSIASGSGWKVSDVICRSGPHNRPFEEQHSVFSIAVVVHGTFQYRASTGRELMVPGSLLLGNAGQCFECSHEHGVGDRCISFSYSPEYLETLASEASVSLRRTVFSAPRVPPLRQLSGVTARARAGLATSTQSSSEIQPPFWEELGVELALRALELASRDTPASRSLPGAEKRVTRIVRLIDSEPWAEYDLSSLAREAALSRYHFTRVFQQLTSITPYQYVRRARLHNAASRLLLDKARVLDVALDSGFGDVSNFNHAFRAEFGHSPRLWMRERHNRVLLASR